MNVSARLLLGIASPKRYRGLGFILVQRVQLLQGMENPRRLKISAADGGQHFVHLGKIEAARHILVIDAGITQTLDVALKDYATGIDIGLHVLLLEPVLDLVTGSRGLEISQMGIEPVPARHTLFDGQHFHLLTGLQCIG